MSEKSEVQDKVFLELLDVNAVVVRMNGGRKRNIPFYHWRAKYLLDDYTDLPEILESAYEFCEPLRRKLMDNPVILTKGISDLGGSFEWGQAYAIECKAPGELGKWSSQEQALYLLEQHARGVAVGVFDNPNQFKPWYALQVGNLGL